MSSKDSHDPGWNDPPIFTYDKATAIQAAAATRKGISLNKRVAFPMSGGVQTNLSSPSDLGKPPPMSQPPLVPPSPPALVTKSNASSPSFSETVTKDRLEQVLRNLQVEASCDDEIAKRIKIMEKMWADEKLEGNVRLRIFELSEALARGDADTADHIQKGLMVDYVSQCSSWMSGIRHLINRKKQTTHSECENRSKPEM